MAIYEHKYIQLALSAASTNSLEPAKKNVLMLRSGAFCIAVIYLEHKLRSRLLCWNYYCDASVVTVGGAMKDWGRTHGNAVVYVCRNTFMVGVSSEQLPWRNLKKNQTHKEIYTEDMQAGKSFAPV